MRDALATEGPVLLDVRVAQRGELLSDDPGGCRRQGHGGLMEAGTPDLIKLEDLDAAAGALTGRKHVLSILVENRPGVLAGSPACSAAGDSTSTPSPSARPRIPRSRASP